jgi:hypothetical protein
MARRYENLHTLPLLPSPLEKEERQASGSLPVAV